MTLKEGHKMRAFRAWREAAHEQAGTRRAGKWFVNVTTHKRLEAWKVFTRESKRQKEAGSKAVRAFTNRGKRAGLNKWLEWTRQRLEYKRLVGLAAGRLKNVLLVKCLVQWRGLVAYNLSLRQKAVHYFRHRQKLAVWHKWTEVAEVRLTRCRAAMTIQRW